MLAHASLFSPNWPQKCFGPVKLNKKAPPFGGAFIFDP
jgi:hypothetical protein